MPLYSNERITKRSIYLEYTKIILPQNTIEEIKQIEKEQEQIMRRYNVLSKNKMFYFDKENRLWKRTISTIKKGKECPLSNIKYEDRPKGKTHYRWRGGITPPLEKLRNCFEYRQWRSDIFTRDKFTCQECGDNRGGNLEAHHIITLYKLIRKYEITNYEQAINCEELWNINNGKTLCKKCHILIHQRYIKS
jgi:hypothetical protein